MDYGCVDWIELTQERDRYRENVGAVIDCRVP